MILKTAQFSDFTGIHIIKEALGVGGGGGMAVNIIFHSELNHITKTFN